MFDQGTQFAGILTRDGTVVEVNRLAVDACGFRREDVLNRPFWDCGWWSPSKEVSDHVRRVALEAANGTTYRGESKYFVADGSERLVDLVLAPVTDQAGHILFVAATGTDITDRRRAERELEVAYERLKLLLDNTKDYGIVITDPAGLVLEWQGGAETITGHAAADVIGQSVDILFSAEDRAARAPAVEMATARLTGHAADKRWHVRRDGTRFFADGIMTALYEKTGELRGFGKVFRDATAHKLAEEALRDNEERLRFLDGLGEATRLASDPGAVMDVATRLLGETTSASHCIYADVESDGNHFTIRHDWFAPDSNSVAGEYVIEAFGPRVTSELRAGRTLVLRDAHRELSPAEGRDAFATLAIGAIVCAPLVKDGQLAAMMAIHQSAPRDWAARDVALVEEVGERCWAHIERVRAAEQLHVEQRRKDEFLATLAHELRNPLAPLRSGLEVLKLAPTGEKAERARAMMERQLSHMVRLVDDLLDISRISRGQFELRRDRVSLREAVEHAVEGSRPFVEAAGHDLVVTLPARPVAVEGDLTRLAQVITNLLDNAAKYTPRGGRIEIEAAREGDKAVLRVSDSGVGISKDMLSQIFDLFAQANRTLDRARGGLGIGLSLVRRLVDMHGGTVEASSEGVGHGSVFTVSLPALPEDDDAPSSVALPEKSAPVLAGHDVLVVDDNEDGAELLATMLELKGHRTRIANTGARALAAAGEATPDVIFLDIGMPGMDGHEVARRLRADPRFAKTVLVALTGWGSADDKKKTREAGFDFHLTKPVDVRAIERLLADLALGKK